MSLTSHHLLYTEYFTEDVCDNIRNTVPSFGEAWKTYTMYHRNFETINCKNGIFIMNVFRYVFDVIMSDIQVPRHVFVKLLLKYKKQKSSFRTGEIAFSGDIVKKNTTSNTIWKSTHFIESILRFL